MPRITVESDALDRLIQYADDQRLRGDSEFLAFDYEFTQSREEFDALVAGLGITLEKSGG